MRILLFTGKGGVGKTTLAAGTAALSAEQGRRTLVISTDAAHSLADALQTPEASRTTGCPHRIAEGLDVLQVDAQVLFEQSWSEIQGYLKQVLDAVGMDPVAAEELTVLPGAEEVLALIELRRRVESGDWDTVVVDCAPTGETLRLLALPEALGWYMQRVLPMERRMVRALKPVLTRATGVPMPTDTVFDAVERLHAELAAVRELLIGPKASVRLVLTPEQVVLAEARRSLTTLSLYGYRVDGVIANRVFPEDDADPWRARWVAAQSVVMDSMSDSFPGVPQWQATYQPVEPVGPKALAELARETYGGHDPFLPGPASGPFRLTRTDAGATLTLALPHARRAEVDLVRHGDDLVVTFDSGAGSYRRLVTMPASLTRYRVVGARVDQGELRVRFEGAR